MEIERGEKDILTAHDVVQYPMIQSASKIATHQDCRYRRERLASYSMAPRHHQSRATPSNKFCVLCNSLLIIMEKITSKEEHVSF